MSVGEIIVGAIGLAVLAALLWLGFQLRRPARTPVAEPAPEAWAELAATRAQLEELRSRLDDREDRLTARLQAAGERDGRLRAREQDLHATAAAHEQAHRREQERLAGLTHEQARQDVLDSAEREARQAAAKLVADREDEAKRTADTRAREILGTALQRVAGETTTESLVAVVHLPQDDLKGRVIGREGRNIRAFEAVTGVNLLVDDTPEAVVVSSFDPVRREVARQTLEALVLDGRIHPQRIEQQYDKALAKVDATMRAAADEALAQVGIDEIHPELAVLLGKLRYRTSYGQNVLKHLVETAHIAAAVAGELGLPPAGIASVKRGAFLHDIGKAVTAEVEGSHALVGAELARRFGETGDVAHAIEAHHEEVPPRTLEAWLTIASDSCSGGRPGARREQPGSFVHRMEQIERLAGAHPGVERVFAMSAGREVRVMVLPEEIDDAGARALAREIAAQIQAQLSYPGEINVTVVRESRASATAH